jgi:hypothetical protein
MMNIINVVKSPEWWHALLGNDFNKGFIAALTLVLVLMLVLMLLRGIFFLIFRSRRCRNIEVKRKDGNTMVSREVIASVVERELEAYPALHVVKILLTRKGAEYQLTIYCSYFLADTSGIPAFCDEFKPKLIAALEKGFGVTSLKKIRLWISESDGTGSAAPEKGEAQKANDDYIGL